MELTRTKEKGHQLIFKQLTFSSCLTKKKRFGQNNEHPSLRNVNEIFEVSLKITAPCFLCSTCRKLVKWFLHEH